MKKLEITPGKFYRLRNGSKYRCYATDGIEHMIHGAYLSPNGWRAISHYENGTCFMDSEYELDIIAEWTEKPEIDRDILPDWANRAVAMDKDGRWFCYSVIPVKNSNHWFAIEAWRIPKSTSDTFNYSSSWEDSLVVFEEESK